MDEGLFEEKYESSATSSYLTPDEPDEFRLRLNSKGFDELERLSQPLWKKWFGNILCNIPTVLVSVVTAVLVAWVLKILELS